MDKLEEVKRIKQLLDDGIIDEDDFAKKKAEILGISEQETKEEIIDEEEGKNKSLDDYEKELIAQSVTEKESTEKSQTKAADDYYQKEKLKVKAKLDAEEEIRAKRRSETKAAVDKGVNVTKKGLKWILAVALWIVGVASICTVFSSGWVYMPLGIIMVIQGCMACPKITEYTQNNDKFQTYTMHKTMIVIITIVVWVALATAFPSTNNTETNNVQSSKTITAQNQ